MSKLFNRTRSESEDLRHNTEGPKTESLNLEALLQGINDAVDEQASGLITSPPELGAGPALDASAGGGVVACEVVEFPAEPYRQMHISRSPERILLPERMTTPAAPEVEAYRSLRTRLLRLQTHRSFRTVVISSAAKGEGKTLTSVNLGLCCAQLPHFRVLLMDADLRTRGLSMLVGSNGTPGLAEVLSGDAQPEAAVAATDVTNLYVMGAGHSAMSPPELFAGTHWTQLIAWAKERFQLVLVDVPPVLAVADCELISASCDGILLVVRARVTSRDMLAAMMGQVDSSKLLGVTLNSVANLDHTSYYYSDYGTKKDESRSSS